MRSFLVVCLTIFILVSGSDQAYAQLNRKGIKQTNKRMSGYRGGKSRFGKEKIYNAIAVSVNALNYYGDLSPGNGRISTDISYTKPGFAISFIHRFGPRYSLQAQFMYGTIKGSDAESADPGDASNGIYRYQRNLSFRNVIRELSVVGIFDLFENESTYMSRVKWTPYAYIGVAIFMHNPQAIAPATDVLGRPLLMAGDYVDLEPLGTEGQHSTLATTDVNYGIKPYSLFQFAIPLGLGARFRLNDVMDLSADFGFRWTFTDYLDDVSQNYVSLGKLNSPLAQSMSYRTGELPGYNPPKNPANSGITYPDGTPLMVESGYGTEHPDNKRGGKNANDIYMVTRIQLSYIINANFHKAKFR